nr:hypothetical protein 28 [bacterium]
MSLKIVSADERLKNSQGVKMVIFGPFGIGKTSLLKTLDDPTLCIDSEAGMLAVQDWGGDSVSVRTWEEARDIACILGGSNPSFESSEPYSQPHYDYLCEKFGGSEVFDKYKCFFFDSITEVARLCMRWCKKQPEAFSEKTGKPDTRGAYGLLGQEMMGWLSQIQHIPNKDIILVGILEQKTDEFNRTFWVPQIEGSKTANELPGILDQVISMVEMQAEDVSYRAFVCQTLNEWKYPAKDRSGRLEIVEEPHLGKLLKKIKSKKPRAELSYEMPADSTTNQKENDNG